MSSKFNVGLDVTGLVDNGKYKPISRITYLLDDENMITAGDDTGKELIASNPHATQAMADAVLASLRGYRYQSFTADAANIDPAAELGDGVSVGNLYGTLSAVSDDGSGYPTISAPGEMELDEEYPEGPLTQEFNRKISETNSRIIKTAEEILLEVSGLSDSVSSISNKVDGITLSVTNGQDSSTIKLLSGSTEISSQEIKILGMVTFSGLADGTTTIDGACIKTGTIDAERINLSGSINFRDFDAVTQDIVSTANNLASEANSAVSGWTYGGTTYIDGGQIMTGTVTASSIRAGSVSLLDGNGDSAGTMTLQSASSGGQKVVIKSGSVELNANTAIALTLSSHGIVMNNNGTSQWAFHMVPGAYADGTYDIGSASNRWRNIYATTGTIQTSDKRKKTDIQYGLGAYSGVFDKLMPMSCKFKDGTSGRTHLALGAQDVEAALLECGFTTQDFAGLIYAPETEEAPDAYGLRYSEFVPLLIHEVQRLKERVQQLEVS